MVMVMQMVMEKQNDGGKTVCMVKVARGLMLNSHELLPVDADLLPQEDGSQLEGKNEARRRERVGIT